ncbi:hypothetical protein CWI38_0012p0020 [Hamiltosporidium tvaerminnensis]|uniref:Transposase n=1 Tax=Hamiltosporidium tvaerminnensis TaxID=1176355 RepID=A0A4Q9M5Q7_9MICR|nr:hypothetical protein CWI38_0012p0020 [Hamiltosporidium tvaerminnensis]
MCDIPSKKKKRCGRKPKDYSNNLARIKNTPLNRLGTFRSISFEIAIPKSTLFDVFKSGKYTKRISSTDYFYGKIGIWPFVYQEPAQRNSKNRVKGTMITINVESVTAVHCKNMIIDNVISAIKSKFLPAYKRKIIYVQQDNAKPYFSDNDADIVALGSADDWNIKFKSQPANTPNLNVLDLASPHTIDELINCQLLEKYVCSKEAYNKAKSNFD